MTSSSSSLLLITSTTFWSTNSVRSSVSAIKSTISNEQTLKWRKSKRLDLKHELRTNLTLLTDWYRDAFLSKNFGCSLKPPHLRDRHLWTIPLLIQSVACLLNFLNFRSFLFTRLLSLFTNLMSFKIWKLWAGSWPYCMLLHSPSLGNQRGCISNLLLGQIFLHKLLRP